MIEEMYMQDAIQQRMAENPLKYAERHLKQSAFYRANQPIRALFWGNRVGKTEAGAMEVARYLLGDHEYRDVQTPIEAWSLCPSFDAQFETTQPKLLRYIPENQIAHKTHLRGKILSQIILKNGSRLNFKSYEQGREKVQGAGKRVVWMDEEPPKDIYEELLVRQEAGIPLDLILTMTPIKGMTWVYDEIYMSTDTNLYYVSTAGWDDNPWLTEDQKSIMSRGLTKAALEVRRYGRFTKRVGLVCHWFDRSKHIRSYSEFPENWSYYEILDGGYSDPAAYLLIGIDTDGNVHVLDGFREKLMSSEDIKNRRDAMTAGLLIRRGWIDSDSPRTKAELRALGMNLTQVVKMKGENASWDEALAEKLAEYGIVQAGTGEPRLFISDKLMRMDEIKGKNINWMMQEIESLLWLERMKDGIASQIPTWDDHRRDGHHFDGIRALAYFLTMYKLPKADQHTGAVVTKINDDPYPKTPSAHIGSSGKAGIL